MEEASAGLSSWRSAEEATIQSWATLAEAETNTGAAAGASAKIGAAAAAVGSLEIEEEEEDEEEERSLLIQQEVETVIFFRNWGRCKEKFFSLFFAFWSLV